MGKSRLLSLAVSTLVCAIFATVITFGLAVFETRIVDSSNVTLRLAGEKVESDIKELAFEAEDLANQLSDNYDLSEAFGFFLKSAPASGTSQRSDSLKKKVESYILEFRNEYGMVSGIAMMGRDGTIRVSQSDFYSEGQKLEPNKESFLLEALEGELRGALVSTERGLRFVGAAPLWDEDSEAPIGIALVERFMPALPELPDNLSVIIYGEGKVQAGKAPSDVSFPKAAPGNLPVRVGQGDARAVVLGVGRIAVEPLLVDRDAIGITAVSFPIPRQDRGLQGYVLNDSSGLFAELGGAQLSLIFVCMFVWLVHLLLIGRGSSDLTNFIEELNDFISCVLQGADVFERPDDGEAPAELERLTTLVNRLAERPAGGSTAAASAQDEAPDYHAILSGPDSDGQIDFASLELDGLLAGRTVQLESLAFAPVEVRGDAGIRPVTRATQPVASAPLDLMDDASARDGSITRPFSTVSVPDADPDFDPDRSYDTISGFLEQVPEVTPSAEPVADDPFLNDSDWDELKLEPLPDDDDFSSDTGDDIVNVAPVSMPADASATSVMRVTPQLMERMRARDPELLSADDEQGSGIFSTSDEAEDSIEKTTQMPAISDQLISGDPSMSKTLVVQSLDGLMTGTGTETNPAIVPPPTASELDLPPAAPSPDTALDADVVFRQVYDDFVTLRAQCGEPGSISFEKFRARLEKSRSMVLEKHGCRDVAFKVYEKNGRAALKATPVT